MKKRVMWRGVLGLSLVASAVAVVGTAPASAALPTGVKLVADLGTGDSSSPYGLTEFGGKVYLAANDGFHENSLFVTDGVGGNSLVIDINPTGNDRVTSIVSNGSKMFFGADNGTNGVEWWVSDGTAAGTSMLVDADPGSKSGYPFGSFVLGSTAYTWMWPTGANGYQLWKSNGTPDSTSMVVETPLWDVSWMGNAGGKAYFVAGGGDPDQAYEVWVTDGTSTGTKLLKNFFTGSSFGGDFLSFTPFGTSMAFGIQKSGSSQNGLWITNGTEAGTTRLYAVSGNEMMRDITVLGGSLYATTEGNTFVNCVSSAGALLKSTGTIEGTTKVVGYACSDFGQTGFRDIGVVGDGLVLTGQSGATGWELWKSDGTAGGTVPVADLVVGNSGSTPTNFVPLNATQSIFYGGAGDPALWVTDGTAVNTKVLSQGGAVVVAERVVVGSKLFFIANDYVHGSEVWVTDGTTEGTEMTYDIRLTGDSTISPPVPFGDEYLFAARRTGYGYELHITDGTTAGTRLVKDINPGPSNSGPSGFAAVGDKMVFTAAPDQFNYRLWITNGTEAGTRQLDDAAGSGGPRTSTTRSSSRSARRCCSPPPTTTGRTVPSCG